MEDTTSSSSLSARPRLLVLASTYPRWRSDPEPNFVHELSRRLTGQFEVLVLCPHSPSAPRSANLDGVQVIRYRYAPEALETLVQHGGILTNLKSNRLKFLLVLPFFAGQLLATHRALRKFNPDIVHAHWIIPQGLVCVLARCLRQDPPPALFTSHGADLFALRSRLLTPIKRFALRHATHVTVVSRSMLAPARNLGVEPRRLSVLPMGVDFESMFTPDPDVPRSTSELLFVGRLVEKKGARVLIEAMPAVLSSRPDTTLTIIGHGPQEKMLRNLASRRGLAPHIRFLGGRPHDELVDHYRRAALLVAPFLEAAGGDQEGLGLVMVEALACGCPALASELPAVRDVLDPDDDSLFLVPAANVEALSARILVLLEQREGLIDHVLSKRSSLSAKFGWTSVAKRYSELMLEMPQHSK